MGVGNLEEIIDDSHAIVSSSVGPEYYVSIMSFVDRDSLEPGCSVLLHNKVIARRLLSSGCSSLRAR
jgi:26S proteasome regulatory subunit T2